MASKKKDTSEDTKSEYQPKATARHAKMTRTKKEEIEAMKSRIETDKHLAKKYESNRKAEIKALPKSERAAAKAELRESVANRKEAERRDREKLQALMWEEKKEKVSTASGKEPFDEDAWVTGGRKKAKKKEDLDTNTDAPVQTEEPPAEPVPEGTTEPEKKD